MNKIYVVVYCLQAFFIGDLYSQSTIEYDYKADSVNLFRYPNSKDSLEEAKYYSKHDSIDEALLINGHKEFIHSFCKQNTVVIGEIVSYEELQDSIQYGVLVLKDLKREILDSTIIKIKLSFSDVKNRYIKPLESLYHISWSSQNMPVFARKARYLLYLKKLKGSTIYTSPFFRREFCFLLYTISPVDTVKKQFAKLGISESEILQVDGCFMKDEDCLTPLSFRVYVPGFTSDALWSSKQLQFVPLGKLSEYMSKSFMLYGK